MLCHRLRRQAGAEAADSGQEGEKRAESGFRRLIESENLRGTQLEMPRRQPCVRVKSWRQDRLETKSGALSVQMLLQSLGQAESPRE